MDKKIEVIISCIDYRFWPEALSIFEKNFGRFDVIEMAGGSKNIASPMHQFDQQAILENIKVSIDLHQAKVIILTNHIDCGAYGGSKKFDTMKEEVAFHKKELKKAKEICQRKFPNLAVKTFLLTRDNHNKVKIL